MNRSIPVLALIALLPSLSFAKSGPEIPRPKVSLCEAAGKVEAYFRKSFGDERPDAASDRFKGECIVQSAQYTHWLSRGDFDGKPGDPNLQLGG